jgi:protein phosphatase
MLDPRNLVTASGTDVGRVRSVNQDAFGEFEDPDRGLRLLVIADGMGGHRGGEVASQLAVERMGELFDSVTDDPPGLLRAAFEGANSRIFDAANRDVELAGMGTTGVAILFDGGETAHVAHVGDSRAYRMRDGQLEQVTDDHSLVGELVRRGQLTAEEARVHPQSNEILRALGTQPDVEVEISEADLRAGDCFLLCSDGLSGMLPDAEIAEVLTEASPDDAVAKLIALANEAGGTDNITVQVARVPDAGSLDTSAGSAPRGEDVGDDGGAAGARPAAAVHVPATEPRSGFGEAGAAGARLRIAMLVLFIAALAWLIVAGLDRSG